MEIPIQEDQDYLSDRGTIYTVEHHNEDIVLLYDGRNYRLEPKDHMQDLIDAGAFELQNEVTIRDSDQRIPFEEIDLIGQTSIESLEDEGLTTPRMIDRTADEVIVHQCRGVGESGLENIKDHIDNEMEL